MQVGDTVQLPDGTPGSIKSLNNNLAVITIGKHVPKYGNEGDRLIATLEDVDCPLENLSPLNERNEHIDKKTGKTFYTDQHGNVIL